MIGTTLDFKRASKFRLSKSDIVALFALLSYVIGFSISVFLVADDRSALSEIAKGIFSKLIEIKSDCNFFTQTLISFGGFAIYFLFSYFLGTCIFGIGAIPAIIVFKGFSDGLLISYIYKTFTLNGIGFSILIVAPYLISFAYLLILACRESLCFSTLIFKKIIPGVAAANLQNSFKLFSIRYGFLLILSVLISLASVCISVAFFDYFNF